MEEVVQKVLGEGEEAVEEELWNCSWMFLSDNFWHYHCYVEC